MTRICAIIPAYNAGRFIAAALDSVVVQQPAPDEIVVVDDGSDDDTAQVVEARRLPGLRLLRQRNAGVSAARNTGLAETQADWIAFLDADDIWTREKLAVQAALAASRNDVDVWLGATEGVSLEPASAVPGRFPASFSSRSFLQLGATLIRRSLFDRVGPFDPGLTFGEDLDWLMRAQERGAVIATHPETVLHYGRHGANMTNDAREMQRGFMGVLKKSLDRRHFARERAS